MSAKGRFVAAVTSSPSPVPSLPLLPLPPPARRWVRGYEDQGRWSDKRAAAAYKTVCAAQAILRDRRKAEVNAQKREVKAKAKAKPTPTRKSKATRKAGAKGGANGDASAGQTASMSGIDE